MRRFIGTCAAVGAVTLGATGVASAATPGASTGASIKATTTSIVVRGRVDPEGEATTYAFYYGVTAAYGSATAVRSAGSGTHPVSVHDRITGLTPGTTYHFQLEATNASGTATGADGVFTTAGTPPSTVITGPPVSVGKTEATATGSINPNGADTKWEIQYGRASTYGLQTFEQELPAGTVPVPVSLQLSGLSPATLFHYRIVAFHGATETDGADETFFTEPDTPPSPDMTTKVTPGTDPHAPFDFTTTGTLNGGQFIPAAQRCTGTVAIRYYNGSHQLGSSIVAVDPACQFSGRVAFSKLHGTGPVKLRVSVFYRGNGYLASASKIDHPVAGHHS